MKYLASKAIVCIEITEPALSVEGRVLTDRDRESLLMPGGIAGSFLVRTISTTRVP